LLSRWSEGARGPGENRQGLVNLDALKDVAFRREGDAEASGILEGPGVSIGKTLAQRRLPGARLNLVVS